METLLISVLILTWFALAVSLLVSSVQEIINNYKREKRDIEYHEMRMRDFK